MSSEPARGQERKTWILALDHPDPERELEFDLAFQASLTTQQRFESMFRMPRLMAEMLARYEQRTGRRAIRAVSSQETDMCGDISI